MVLLTESEHFVHLSDLLIRLCTFSKCGADSQKFSWREGKVRPWHPLAMALKTTNRGFKQISAITTYTKYISKMADTSKYYEKTKYCNNLISR